MFINQIKNYQPINEQEARDKEIMLWYCKQFPETVITRENEIAHLTASSWIVNKSMTKALLIFHNIYNSWSWTGGHTDGDRDLLYVSMKEAMEETGLSSITPYSNDPISLDILPVWGHEKRGKYVSAHLHLNLAYLLVADDTMEIKIKADENSNVKWFDMDDTLDSIREPDMFPVYQKLLDRVNSIK